MIMIAYSFIIIQVQVLSSLASISSRIIADGHNHQNHYHRYVYEHKHKHKEYHDDRQYRDNFTIGTSVKGSSGNGNRSENENAGDGMLPIEIGLAEKDKLQLEIETMPDRNDRLLPRRVQEENIIINFEDPNDTNTEEHNQGGSTQQQKEGEEGKEKEGDSVPMERIIRLVSIIVLISIAAILTIGWLVILFLRCKYKREQRRKEREHLKQQEMEQRLHEQLQMQREARRGDEKVDDNEDDDDDDDARSCFSNTTSVRSGMYKNHQSNHKYYHHHKLKSSTASALSFNHNDYYYSQRPQSLPSHRQHNNDNSRSLASSTPSKNKRRNQYNYNQHNSNSNNVNTSFFPISFKRQEFESPYASTPIVFNNDVGSNRSKNNRSSRSIGKNTGTNSTTNTNAIKNRRYSKSKSPTNRDSQFGFPSTTPPIHEHDNNYNFNEPIQPIAKKFSPRNATDNNNTVETPSSFDNMNDDESDSFAKELETAKAIDHRNYVRKQKENQGGDPSSMLSMFPKISPPKNDVAPIQLMDYMKDSFTNGINYMQGLMYNQGGNRNDGPDVKDFPMSSSGPTDVDSHHYKRQHHHLQQHSFKDPETILALTSTSGSSSSTNSSSTYAGKHSSVEEEEGDGSQGRMPFYTKKLPQSRSIKQRHNGEQIEEGDEEGGEGQFHIISNHGNKHYQQSESDEMNAYLLNNISANNIDDRSTSTSSSFGNKSGMEMSLGGHTRSSTGNKSASTITSSVVKQGFRSIHDENQDLMYDYIPREEYDAAVLAAAAVIDRKGGASDNDQNIIGRSSSTPRISNSLRKMTSSPSLSKSSSSKKNDHFDTHREMDDHVTNVPSDEAYDEIALKNNNGQHQQVQNHRQNQDFDSSVDTSIELDNTTSTGDLVPGTATTNSSSFTTSSNSMISSNDSEPLLMSSSSDNHKLFKELKNVSIFLKRYENKKNSKREQKGKSNRYGTRKKPMLNIQTQQQGYDGTSITSDNHSLTDGYDRSVAFSNSTSSPEMSATKTRYSTAHTSSSSPSSSPSSIASEEKNIKYDKYPQGGNDHLMPLDSRLHTITTKRKQNRHEAGINIDGKETIDNGMEHTRHDTKQEGTYEEINQKSTSSNLRTNNIPLPPLKSIMQNKIRQRMESRRSTSPREVKLTDQYPLRKKGQHRPQIGITQSLDSTNSDANFLENEIQSFFSQKDTSMTSASMVSTSVSEATTPTPPRPTSRYKPTESLNHRFDETGEANARSTAPSKSQNRHHNNQSTPTVGGDTEFESFSMSTMESVNEGSSLNRLGAAPYDPLESMSQPQPQPQPMVGSTDHIDSAVLETSEREFDDIEHDSYDMGAGRSEDNVIIDQKQTDKQYRPKEAEIQRQQRSSSFIGERAQNLKSMVVEGIGSKLETGAGALVSIFNSKRSNSPTTSMGAKERKVFFADEDIDIEANSVQNTRSNVYADQKTKTNFSGEQKVNEQSITSPTREEIVSPTVINRVPGRKASPRLYSTPQEQQSGDKPVEASNEKLVERKSPTLSGRLSPRINTTARSLISMFESKKSSSSPITPQNEYWQYTGKLKNKR